MTLDYVTFACEDPQRVADFWSAVLGYEASPAAGESWEARDPRGEGPSLFFNHMAKSPTIEVPIHLDVNAPDRETAVQRVRALGALLVETKTSTIGDFSETFTVMRDVEGNGFCVQGPDPHRPHAYVRNVTFASAAPPTLGAWWSEALGWPEEPIDPAFLQRLLDAGLDPRERETYYALSNPDGGRLRLLFQRREKSRPESYPLHLDFRSDGREREVERLTGIGATVVETKSNGTQTWTVLRDPEGNPFCVE